jgi:3-deoxy-D-manno-octulosonic-acid transferase
VAGSSWQPDEDIFIPYFNEHRDWKLIIAPHVISEDHLGQIVSKLAGRKVERYTQATEESVKDADVLIVDCFGLLSSIYHYADVTYVGGGFGVGIHNTLEAAVWDVPVIFGPNNQRFQEAQGLKACGGGLEISCAADFQQVMQRFTSEPQSIKDAGRAAGAFVKQMTGATQKIMQDVKL